MGILAQAQGLTFELPRSQPQGALGQQSGQGAQGDVGSIMGAPPTGLENVTNVTNAFYKKWGDLEAMAQTAKQKYGIDITRPQFDSAEAMELHKIYKQGLADIRFQGNKLQQAQKDLTQYQGQAFGATGEELSYAGNIGQEVFDPSKVTRIATPSNAGQFTARDLELDRRRVKAAALKAANDKAKAKAKDTNKEKEFAAFKQTAEDVAKIGSGAVKWTIDADGKQTSTFWKGMHYGTRSESGVIQGFERIGGISYLIYGKDGENKIEVNPETESEIFNGYILGQYSSAKERKIAANYLESLQEQGVSIFDMAPEDAASFTDAANQEVVSMGENKAYADEMKGHIDNGKIGAPILDSEFKGVKFTANNGKEYTIKEIKNNIFKGVTFYTEEGKEFDISSSGNNKSNIVDQLIKGKGGLQQPKETLISNPTEEQYNALPKGAEFEYNGEKLIKQ